MPIVGEHTCLKIIAEPQLGEVSVGNNSAQENVFNFQPAAASVPEPIVMPVAVRNPRDTEARVEIRVSGVPEGYLVYLPYRWVRLGPRGEQRMDLLIVPTADLKQLRAIMERVRKQGEGRVDPAARVRVSRRDRVAATPRRSTAPTSRVVVLPDRRDRRPGRAEAARRHQADRPRTRATTKTARRVAVQGAVRPRTPARICASTCVDQTAAAAASSSPPDCAAHSKRGS